MGKCNWLGNQAGFKTIQKKFKYYSLSVNLYFDNFFILCYQDLYLSLLLFLEVLLRFLNSYAYPSQFMVLYNELSQSLCNK